ncbi:MAG TPA: GNAT family N-acetyltransferase [Amaricoccus sp.]|uniref:GNAT family N-acetyltransferase n=1 Tax=Amaricoccus sp. TaxID=1872485 RepID=UPI002B608DBB|nr:GNAT family N-acetyltransferase [Amaricoccus sp.]HMQ92785.1 GNAT family N-acetyltransferase [Amaricoccus sp.]HMR52151.1 GNAT family N-acetyltransferase [Amaricoccus sp.]HMR59812.1 GNAT family N-acetyltransferase [Amaricoccus sp.]HMT99003.1 GNAT family N-acetyltransferase [Amaricoccus sp.]
MTLEIRPADWEGFAAVMGERGGCGGCWCMLWRRSKAEMDAGMGAPNRAAMADLFAPGDGPGLVARRDGLPVGWIQVDRRAAFPRLARSRVLRPVDAQPVWSVACFLVDRTARRQGVSVALLRAACGFARDRGATILEGYPVDPPKPRYPPVYAWTGFVGTFRAAGFEEVARHAPTRPIMRRHLA